MNKVSKIELLSENLNEKFLMKFRSKAELVDLKTLKTQSIAKEEALKKTISELTEKINLKKQSKNLDNSSIFFVNDQIFDLVALQKKLFFAQLQLQVLNTKIFRNNEIISLQEMNLKLSNNLKVSTKNYDEDFFEKSKSKILQSLAQNSISKKKQKE